MSNQNNKQCAGTYPVSGYTREDGTKVSGYMRTCGAKHVGNSFETISSKLQRNITKNINIDKIFLKYYAISLDMENKKQFDTDNSYMEFKDIQNDKLKNFIRSECNIENLNDYTNVVISQYASPLNNSVVNSVELNNFIENNKIALQRGDFKDKHVDIVFNSTSDLSLTIGKAKLYNPQLDKYGNFSGIVVDYYDFSKLSPDYSNIKSMITVMANNNAYQQQNHGYLKPYILVIPLAKF